MRRLVAPLLLLCCCANNDVSAEVSAVADIRVVPIPQTPRHPTPPAGAGRPGAARSDLSYMDTLLRLRQTNDLQPWVEPVNQLATSDSSPAGIVFPAGTPANGIVPATYQVPYSIIASELLMFGSDVHGGVDASPDRVHAKLSHWFVEDPKSEPPRIIDDLLLGTLVGGLNKFQGGLYLPGKTVRNFRVETLAAVSAGHTTVFYPTFRGYQLRPKGSLNEVQRTWSEWAAEGYEASWWPLAIEVTPPAAPSMLEGAADLLFTEDTLVDALVLEPLTSGGAPAVTPEASESIGPNINYLVKIDPLAGGQNWMSSWVSVPTLAWILRESSIQWPIPFFVPKGTTWRFRVRKAIDDNDTINPNVSGSLRTINFTLVAYKLTRQR